MSVFLTETARKSGPKPKGWHEKPEPGVLNVRLLRSEESIKRDLARLLGTQLEDQRRRWGRI